MRHHRDLERNALTNQPSGSALSGFVFHRNGKRINKTVFGKQWRAACVKAGLGRRVKDEKGVEGYEGKIFHDLRRTAARNMIRGGSSQTWAMEITGHKTDSQYRRYDITTDVDKLKALEAAQRYVESSSAEQGHVVPMKDRKV